MYFNVCMYFKFRYIRIYLSIYLSLFIDLFSVLSFNLRIQVHISLLSYLCKLKNSPSQYIYLHKVFLTVYIMLKRRSSRCLSLSVTVWKEFTLRWKLKKGTHKNLVRTKREWNGMGKIERALACSLTQLVFVTVALIGWLASILCAWPLSPSVSSYNVLVHIAINWAVAIVRPVLVLVLFSSPFSVFFFYRSLILSGSFMEYWITSNGQGQFTMDGHKGPHNDGGSSLKNTHTRTHTKECIKNWEIF